MKRYTLTFWVPILGKGRKGQFYITVELEETIDIQGFKEGLAMEYEKYFQTPVQCIAVNEIE